MAPPRPRGARPPRRRRPIRRDRRRDRRSQARPCANGGGGISAGHQHSAARVQARRLESLAVPCGPLVRGPRVTVAHLYASGNAAYSEATARPYRRSGSRRPPARTGLPRSPGVAAERSEAPGRLRWPGRPYDEERRRDPQVAQPKPYPGPLVDEPDDLRREREADEVLHHRQPAEQGRVARLHLALRAHLPGASLHPLVVGTLDDQRSPFNNQRAVVRARQQSGDAPARRVEVRLSDLRARMKVSDGIARRSLEYCAIL